MKSIMIVDDSPTMPASIESILSSDNFSVDAADSGDAACKKLNGGAKPDLIISDVNMPNMDGITFVKELKQNARYKFTPVIMLTTEAGKDKMDFTSATKTSAKAWKDIWGAGQGVGNIDEVASAHDIVLRMESEYRAALARVRAV